MKKDCQALRERTLKTRRRQTLKGPYALREVYALSAPRP